MNETSNHLDISIPDNVTDFSWLTGMGPAALTFFLVTLLAYFCIRFAFIPTRLMWLMSLFGTVFYTLAGPLPPACLGCGAVEQWTMKVGVAIGLGVLGVFAAMGCHDKMFRQFAKWWPALGWLCADTNSTGNQP